MRAFISLLLLPLPAFAGDDGFIPGEKWRALVTGKTVEYAINGVPFVREYYWATDDVVTMEVIGQDCFESRWDYAADTGIYCFHNSPTACFWHVRQGDRLFVQDADPGPTFGQIQDITAITDTRLSCATEPVS